MGRFPLQTMYIKPRRHQPIPEAGANKVVFNWPEPEKSTSDQGNHIAGSNHIAGKVLGHWESVVEKQNRNAHKIDHTVPNAVQRLAKFRQGYYALFQRSGIQTLGSDVADGIDSAFLTAANSGLSSEEKEAIINHTNEFRNNNRNSLRIANVHKPPDPMYLRNRCSTLEEENKRLQNELRDLKYERDNHQCETQPAPDSVRHSQETSIPRTKTILNQETLTMVHEVEQQIVDSHQAKEMISMEILLAVFDAVDEDETGFAPRLDLRKKVDEYIDLDPKVQELSDQVRALDVMILERDDFEEMVKEWLSGCAGLTQSSIGFD